MFDILLKGNYINIINEDSDNVTDRSAAQIEIVRKNDNSTTYSVRYQGAIIDNLVEIPWDDFTLNGVPFADQNAFEDWKNENTGLGAQSPTNGGGSGGERTPSVVEAVADGSTIAGVRSVALWFRGNGGTLNGVPQPNNATPSFSPNAGEDTLGALNFEVPTTGQQRVIIYYIL